LIVEGNTLARPPLRCSLLPHFKAVL
jgi:hypothetical protein